MQAVGRLGSYISKSVYTVSGPFHPFGGAVDIIIIEQPDGSYKSSPWYVRFGKFQGVLKTKEKVVSISVNGVEADFHMLLDHKGEAYFLKEVDVEEGEPLCSPSSSGEDTDRQPGIRRPIKSNSCNYDANWSESLSGEGNRNPIGRTNSRRSQILGLVFGRRSRKENGIPEENGSGVIRTESLERAEVAADLLELKWSTNLVSSRLGKNDASRISADNISKNSHENLPVNCSKCDTSALVSHSSSEEEGAVVDNGIGEKILISEVVTEVVVPIGNGGEDYKFSNSEPLVPTVHSCTPQEANHIDSVILEMVKSDLQIHEAIEKLNVSSDPSSSMELNKVDNLICHDSETSKSSQVGSVEQINDSFSCGVQEVCVFTETDQECLGNGNLIHEMKICPDGGPLYSNIVTKSYSEEVSHQLSDDFLQKVQSQNFVTISTLRTTCKPLAEGATAEEDHVNNNGSSMGPFRDPQMIRCMLLSGTSEEEELLFGKMDDFDSGEPKLSEPLHADEKEKAHCSCSKFSLVQSIEHDCMNDDMQKKRLRTIASDANISATGLVQSEVARRVRSLPSMSPISGNFDINGLGHPFGSSMSSIKAYAGKDDKLNQAQSTTEDLRKSNGNEYKPPNRASWNPPRPIDPFRGNRRGWSFSFRRARSLGASTPVTDGKEFSGAKMLEKSASDLEGAKDGTRVNMNMKKVRVNTPTSEQLASLNLKEGKNIVVFTFSTAMLGKQQVDARIFVWKWDTRIVISDVDGTITRSDLLGQVMPLVGMDWSQIGVAHLFSAIKENGYQILFLSARSISQAFHTRQFLFNIKQDGKALPEGPVVISPDGLFPSLFREVVRRAPHEFKIACLEDIKALFPADTNPFYAGFGNRDTDEFSYLKVGIPRNKIFIINPKGEIVVNRRVDTKSYLSLHTLVHGMFPTMSSSEQEDFNSWNYWKLPPPTIDV